jgi:hypothetical protein
VDTTEYEVMCPNAILGCSHSCPRACLTAHLEAECCYGAQAAGPREALEERQRSLQVRNCHAYCINVSVASCIAVCRTHSLRVRDARCQLLRAPLCCFWLLPHHHVLV